MTTAIAAKVTTAIAANSAATPIAAPDFAATAINQNLLFMIIVVLVTVGWLHHFEIILVLSDDHLRIFVMEITFCATVFAMRAAINH